MRAGVEVRVVWPGLILPVSCHKRAGVGALETLRFGRPLPFTKGGWAEARIFGFLTKLLYMILCKIAAYEYWQ